MKNKSWIIILIMGIALTISVGYSIVISQKKAEKESTVTTTSIIEMTATTATIKNTLKGSGTVKYKEESIESTTTENPKEGTSENNNEAENTEKIKKVYEITLSVEDKDFNKVKESQSVEISIKKEDKTLNYIGRVKHVNKDPLAKSTIDIEITNPDENLQADLQAVCTIIIEKAENVVALPIEAIQKDEEQKKYVDLVVEDGNTTKLYIKTGISDDYYVEIEEGLNVGDRVQIVKSSTTVVNNGEKNILKPTSEK